MQALPVLGVLFRDFSSVQAKSLIGLGALVWVGLTILTFLEAISGLPFIHR